ncbi:MAG: NAD(P)(+) transhydrogenase (Re/Si-specific) subunit beta [Actinomycetota bacterium]
MSENLVSLSYLVSGVCFIFALKWLSHPSTARRGVQIGEAGMVLAVITTLLKTEIVNYEWILVAGILGIALGVPLGRIRMTAVPQRTALSHAFGALAAGLVGTAEYYLGEPHLSHFEAGAIGVEVLLGFLTVTGSLIAAGKLQGIFRDKPFVYPGQNIVNIAMLVIGIGLIAALVADPSRTYLFPILIVVSLIVGFMLVIRIGGADMPTVISLLNSYAGLSAAAMGFVLHNELLIIAGALDGSSGLILSLIMSKAMNRSFRNVIFGGFGVEQTAPTGEVETRPVRSVDVEETAMLLDAAQRVIIVPGYGMAAAQAQHKVRELYDALNRRGVEVLFAIHPVAGRMPGHMNVLLAEADVPYDALRDLDEINEEFAQTDVALVVGANDVVNPAARNDPNSPIHGMPILAVDQSRSIIVVKRSMRSGFAGIENELFYLDKTQMLFGDAKQVIGGVVDELQRLPARAAAGA